MLSGWSRCQRKNFSVTRWAPGMMVVWPQPSVSWLLRQQMTNAENEPRPSVCSGSVNSTPELWPMTWHRAGHDHRHVAFWP